MSTTISSAGLVSNSKDLVGEILSRLPLRSVMRCRLVCKEWCSLTSTQSFIDMHENINKNNNNSCLVVQYFDKGTSTSSDYFNTLFFNLDDNNNNMNMNMVREYMDLSHLFKTYYHIELISSCGGFLLFTAKPAPPAKIPWIRRCLMKPTDHEEESPALILYNPVTKEQLTVIAHPSKYICCGFYYHSPTKVHKILYRLFPGDAADPIVKFLVFSLENYAYRFVKVMRNPHFRYQYCLPDPSTPPVISNGSLHWIVSEDDHHGHHNLQNPAAGYCSYAIMSFEMESEKFRWRPHPTLSHPCSQRGSKGHYHHMNLLEMAGGVLCLCDGYKPAILEIYVMEDYEKWSWVRRYLIDLSQYMIIAYTSHWEYGLHYKALQILQGDQLLLHVRPNSPHRNKEEYVLYSLKKIHYMKKIDVEKQLIECTYTDIKKKKNIIKRQRFQAVIDRCRRQGDDQGLLGRLRRMIIKPANKKKKKRQPSVGGNMVVVTPSLLDSFQRNKTVPQLPKLFRLSK